MVCLYCGAEPNTSDSLSALGLYNILSASPNIHSCLPVMIYTLNSKHIILILLNFKYHICVQSVIPDILSNSMGAVLYIDHMYAFM